MTRDALQHLAPYVPGTTIEEVQRQLGLERVIKLASNENPLGSSPRALAALRDLGDLHLYADDAHEMLRERIGQRYGLKAPHVVLGHGSNELVNIICQGLLDAGDRAVMARPTFSLYRLAVTIAGGSATEVPLRDGVHDLDALLGAIDERTRLVFVCDPNNPTGTALDPQTWNTFVRRLPERVYLVVDQAYREYTDSSCVDAAAIVPERARTLVLRTMSKIYGLAALRFGYAFGDPETIELLNRVRLPFNVSRPAALGALGALEDDAFVQQSVACNREGKSFMLAALRDRGLHVYDTQANFYAVGVPVSATQAYEALLRRGVITRSGDALGMPGYLRITIGTREQNEALLEALDAERAQW